MQRKRNMMLGVIGVTSAALIGATGLQAQRGQGQARGRPPATTPVSAGQGKPSGTPGRPTTTPPPQAGDHRSGNPSPHGSNAGGRPTVGQLVTQNANLASRLQALLPGTNLQAAGEGFRNLGQFVAAAHVSHNLDIPFDQLKATMLGPGAESLGSAIHALKPAADAKAEAKKAEKNADADIKASQGKRASS